MMGGLNGRRQRFIHRGLKRKFGSEVKILQQNQVRSENYAADPIILFFTEVSISSPREVPGPGVISFVPLYLVGHVNT